MAKLNILIIVDSGGKITVRVYFIQHLFFCYNEIKTYISAGQEKSHSLVEFNICQCDGSFPFAYILFLALDPVHKFSVHYLQ